MPFTGYRAVGGVIQTGPVSIGREALIGEHTVLDIGTSVGEGSHSGIPQPCTSPRPCPTASAGTDPPHSPPTWTTAPSIPSPPAGCAGQPMAPLQLLTLLFVTLPLAVCVASRGSPGCQRSSR